MSPTKSTLLKILAWFLAVATGLSAIVGICANIYAMETDMYTDDTSYYDTAWFEGVANSYWYQVVDSYEFGYVSDALEDSNNIGYRMEDAEGNILSEKPLPVAIGTVIIREDFLRHETIPVVYETDVFDFKTDADAWEMDTNTMEINGTSYETIDLETPIPILVTLYVAEDMDLKDDFAASYMTYHFIAENLDILPVFTIASVLVCILAIIFSVCAVGHQKGTDEIVPNIQDKIPLDFYLCMAAALVVIPFWGTMYIVESGIRPTTIYTVLVIFGLYGLSILLACLLTFATRLKLGKWWRNTLVYRIVSWCLGLCKNLIEALPMVLLVGIFWSVCSFVFFCFAYDRSTTLLFSFFLGLFFLYLAIQIDILKKAGKQLAEGRLNGTISTKWLLPPFKTHLSHLTDISNAITKAVNERMKSEHMKTELITNVSHDIKTPLTSIINYVDLMQKEDLSPKCKDYLEVVDRHSKRLKKLTTDLVEVSKASTGNIPCDLQPTDLSELIHQALAEYAEKWQNNALYPVLDIPETNLLCMIDGALTWRVLNNILNNASKYAQDNTRIYISIEKSKEVAILSVKNISKEPLNIPANELMERFVRGDVARSTEGSGLGLNIAKSLVELQNGSFVIDIDGDLFKTILTLPLANQ